MVQAVRKQGPLFHGGGGVKWDFSFLKIVTEQLGGDNSSFLKRASTWFAFWREGSTPAWKGTELKYSCC